MVAPSSRLPQATTLQVSVLLYVTQIAGSLQHGDVLFIDDTNFSFIYLTAILCAAAQHAH